MDTAKLRELAHRLRTDMNYPQTYEEGVEIADALDSAIAEAEQYRADAEHYRELVREDFSVAAINQAIDRHPRARSDTE